MNNNKENLISILDKLITEYGYRNWRRGSLVGDRLKSWENDKIYFGLTEEQEIDNKKLTNVINNIDETTMYLKNQIKDKELIKKMKSLREKLKLDKHISIEDEDLIIRLSNKKHIN